MNMSPIGKFSQYLMHQLQINMKIIRLESRHTWYSSVLTDKVVYHFYYSLAKNGKLYKVMKELFIHSVALVQIKICKSWNNPHIWFYRRCKGFWYVYFGEQWLVEICLHLWWHHMWCHLITLLLWASLWVRFIIVWFSNTHWVNYFTSGFISCKVNLWYK